MTATVFLILERGDCQCRPGPGRRSFFTECASDRSAHQNASDVQHAGAVGHAGTQVAQAKPNLLIIHRYADKAWH
jgi:hypothetical protein